MHTADLIYALKQLVEETPAILASPEDALYFRTFFKQKSALPSPEPALKIARKEEKTEIAPSKPSTEPLIENRQPLAPVKVEAPLPQKVLEPAPVEPKTPPISSAKLPMQERLSGETNLKLLFQKIAPQVAILSEIPNDAIAKKIATRWKTRNQIAPISILSMQEPSKQKALLGEISKAIDIVFGPARLIEAEPIERENQWDTFLNTPSLKCILACDYTLWQLGALMPFYKENSGTQTRMLGNVPLLLLPDLSLYLKDPSLKKSLWKALCHKLSS